MGRIFASKFRKGRGGGLCLGGLILFYILCFLGGGLIIGILRYQFVLTFEYKVRIFNSLQTTNRWNLAHGL